MVDASGAPLAGARRRSFVLAIARHARAIGDPRPLKQTRAGCTLMNNDQIKGTVDKVAGTVKQHVGDMSDDEQMELEGAARRGAGKARDSFGDAMDSARDYTERQPLGALGIAVGAGVLVGLLLASRRGD